MLKGLKSFLDYIFFFLNVQTNRRRPLLVSRGPLVSELFYFACLLFNISIVHANTRRLSIYAHIKASLTDTLTHTFAYIGIYPFQQRLAVSGI